MDVYIGITTSFNDDEQRLDRAYVEAVAAAGGVPLLLPMAVPAEVRARALERVDGLILTGGPAIVQGLIGELPEDLGTTHPVRTEADEDYLTLALERGMPILGICYGMQLLNARAGGTIYADVERQQKAQTHSAKRGAETHEIAIVPGSVLHDLVGQTTLSVNTRHIQALAEVGSGYAVSAVAPDGVIEAIERPDGQVLGVQFHPEKMGASVRPLFQHLVQRARTFAFKTAPG